MSYHSGIHDKIIDIRVVVATNADLWKMVREGSFRKDLFHRLNVVPIDVPPLRDRKNDIPLLTDYFLSKHSFKRNKKPPDLPDRVAKLFMEYQWPGNVRQLENVVRRAIALQNWSFTLKELNLENTGHEGEHNTLSGANSTPLGWDDDKELKLFRDSNFSLEKIRRTYVSEAERKVILKALEETDWNKTKAARLLRVSYKTLLNRIRKYKVKMRG